MASLLRFVTHLPEFEHEARARQARLINLTVWLVVVSTSLATINSMLTNPRGLVMYSVFGGLVVALLVARRLVVAKQLDAAGYLVTGSIWAVIAYVIAIDGLASPAIGGLAVVAIIGAAVVGAGGAAAVGVASALLIGTIHLASEAGWLEPSSMVLPPRAMAITYATQIMTAAILIALLSRERNQAFTRAYELAHNSPDGIVAMNAGALVHSVNAAFEQITGLARGEVLGRTPDSWSVLDEHGRERMRAAMHELAGDSESVSFELELGPSPSSPRANTDARVQVECLARKSSREGTASVGEAAHWVQISIRDITKRKQLEQQLLQAQKMESIGRLAGGIAHDFNNILTAIHGNASLIEEQASEAQREDIHDLLASVDRAAALTRQLLAFSRQRRELSQPTDVVRVARELAPMLRRLIGEDVRLNLSLAAAPQIVLGDPTQFEQIIVNLVVNARDALARGGDIELGIEASEPGGVLLRVRDSGEGMSADAVERAFEPFFSTKAVGKGTGLGLSVVHGTVTQLGGRVEIISELGRGTTVDVWFPRSDARLSDDAAALTPELPSGTELLLLVEDDEHVRRVLERMLSSAGYRIIAVADAEQALARVAERGSEIDLVLSDVIMPKVSGFELAAVLSERLPDTPILLMSGYSGEALASKLPPSSRDWPLIHKPFTAAQLGERLRELLRGGATE